MMIFGSCDCCEARHRILHGWSVQGLETWACTVCSYGDITEDICDLEDEIEAVEAIQNVGDDNADYLKHLKRALAEARNSTNEHASHRQAGEHSPGPRHS